MNLIVSGMEETSANAKVKASGVVLSRPLLAADLLRRLFLRGPNDEVLGLALAAAEAEGGTPALDEALSELSSAAEDVVEEGAPRLTELAAEFTRLIVGPAKSPAVPYASFYLSATQLVMTEETLAVRRQYVEAGVARREDVRIPDDHLGIELDFLYFLERAIALSEAGGDAAAAKAARTRRAEFVGGHLLQWVPRFASDVCHATKDEFVLAAIAVLVALLGDASRKSTSR